jgi:hypothetical protein
MKFFNEMCKKLRNGEPFKFSRFGDGEWLCMMGRQGKNRDGNDYLPELGRSLREILNSEPDYYIGLQPGVLVDVGRGYDPEMREFVMKTIFQLDLNLVIGDTLHYASEFGFLDRFINSLKNRFVITIGAEYFEELPYAFIKTNPTNSFHDNDRIINEANDYIDDIYDVNPVCLVANAMNSNVIIDKLSKDITAIDIGSVFDPYLGRPRASYQHNMKAEWLW